MISSFCGRLLGIDQNPIAVLTVKVEQIIEVVSPFSSIASKEVDLSL
jgi:hypothetical protein